MRSTGSIHLIYHPKYAELASTAREQDSQTTIIQLSHITTDRQQDPIPSGSNFSSGSLNEVSHIFHTSGTSGTPKPIPQTHLASVSVLPRRALPSYLSALAAAASPSKPTELPSEPAAFTTTPLFHGGVSDLLRAWMARSMIYFYPTSDTPITSQNVVQALKATESPPPALSGTSFSESQLSERAKRFRVASFLSVPYVLTILSEDLDGPAMEMLERMEFVSTGGAPLDTRIGDAMVARGVRLVSRLGSSECGCKRKRTTSKSVSLTPTVLLSSHRDYETERDWEWLRNDSAFSDALSFELFKGDGETKEEKFEMVVTDKWTSKVSRCLSFTPTANSIATDEN